MTSEGTGAVSLQAETPDSEVAKKIQPSPPPPPESAPSTSNDVPQLGTTEANECFYSDHMAIRAPINNSHQGYVPGAPEGGDGSMPNPSMQYNYAVEHQFGNTMISTLQIPPPGGRWNDILHTCGYDCYQSQSDCPKRQASSSGMNERQQKYTKTDLGSGQIVERCGFGPGRNERQQTKTRTDLGSSQIVERCGLGTSRPDGHQKDTRTDRVSRENLFVKRGCDKLGMLPTRGGRDSNRTGDGRGSSTFHRRWTYTRYANDIFRGKSNKPTADSQLEFTVASYNVLAQNLLEDHLCLYVGCDDTALEWEYRSKNLLEEIKLHQPDILCMQEVNAIHYEEFFEPELKQLGYGGEFKKRTGRMMDGCATFFKTHKFQLRHCEPVEYSTRNVSVLNRDNVALLLLLCPVLQPALSLCVANTHLLFNPRRGDVKLAQLMVLLAKIDQVTYKGPSKPCTPVYDPCILCGDFNSMPDSELYKLLNGGQLNYEGLITRTLSGQEQSDPLDPYQNCMTNAVLPPSMFIADQCRYIGENDYRPYTQGQGVMSHRLNLQSVYKHVSKRGEKEVTTHHSLTNETVDYIFYSLAGPEVVPPEADASGPMPTEEGPLKLMGSLQLITAQEMDNSGTMPNRSLSSDHLILMAKFLWDLKYCSPAK